MSEKYVKVSYVDENKSFSFYTTNLTTIIERLPSHIANILSKDYNVDANDYRLFWKDNDGDEIELVTWDDYTAFWELCGEKPHLMVTPASTVRKPTAPGNKHEGVICDNCGMIPIVGFRYKCVECSDFDLCEKCEQRHVHSVHALLRLPNNSSIREQMEVPSTSSGNTYTRPKTNENNPSKSCSNNNNNAGQSQKNDNNVDALSITNSTLNNIPQIIDPQTFKQTLQMFNSLSNMFGKILDSFEGMVENVPTSSQAKETVESNTECVSATNSDVDWHMIDESASTSNSYVQVAPDLLDNATPTNLTGVNYAQTKQQDTDKTAATVNINNYDPDVQITGIIPPVENNERRAVIVHHPDSTINNAIETMLNMGFTNEEQWLTKLLESVQGNIDEALEHISTVQSTN